MNFEYLKKNFIIFIISYFMIITIFAFTSYKFFITDFITLEKEQNGKNVSTILTGLNYNIDNIEKLVTDYSKWDDTFNFITNPNKEYIHENFREGTTTLSDLGLDFMIFATLKQKTVYSKYPNKMFEKEKQYLENKIYKDFKNINNINTIFRFKSYSLYLIKAEVLKSDNTGVAPGHMYAGKIINNKNLNEITKVFNKMYMSNEDSKGDDFDADLLYVKNVKLSVKTENSNIINNIQILDDNNQYVFSIITQSPSDIVNNGKNTIIIFNSIISIFMFIILYIIYRNQNVLERYNELLKSKVTLKTNQLNRTLRKLKTKNRELYTLANVDSLTKIRNRRNYFIESQKTLDKSILNNTNLSVLMMDIDYFKKINDTYGHSVGDKVLIEFCSNINTILDEDAIFGRIGGEEFCITFNNIELKEVIILAEQIRDKCEKTIIKVDDKEINFTLSLGLSNRENFKNIDEILQVADKLLYKAKESGRNRLIRTTVH